LNYYYYYYGADAAAVGDDDNNDNADDVKVSYRHVTDSADRQVLGLVRTPVCLEVSELTEAAVTLLAHKRFLP
jgi:hypothetical protein